MLGRNALSDKSNRTRHRTPKVDLKSLPAHGHGGGGEKLNVMENLLSRNLVVRNGTKNSNMRESTKRTQSMQHIPSSSYSYGYSKKRARIISTTGQLSCHPVQSQDNRDSISKSSPASSDILLDHIVISNDNENDDEEEERRTKISDFSVECLHRIFAFCANPRDLCTISTVCRKWHEIISDQWMWRNLDVEWSKFTVYMYKLYLRKSTAKSLSHTRSLRLHGNPTVLRKYRLHAPNIYPFKSLQSLQLQDMFLDDMVEIAMWMTNLEKLRCDNVITRQDNNEIMLTVFSRLQKLRILSITFQQPCSHAGNAFSITGRSRKALPSSLEELSITSLYDSEEYLMSKTEIHLAYDNPELMMRWNLMEESLLAKYRPFSHLSHLRSLSLGRCSGFTARVWRECLLPCTKNLECLSLTGWRSGRESPVAWQQRHAQATVYNIDIREVPEQVEEAIAELIGNMQRIRSLELNDFYCGQGIVQGIQSLPSLQPSIVGASVLNAHGPLECVADLLHVHVSFCKIIFSQANKIVER